MHCMTASVQKHTSVVIATMIEIILTLCTFRDGGGKGNKTAGGGKGNKTVGGGKGNKTVGGGKGGPY